MKHARSYECFLLHPPSKATLWFTSRSVERDVEIQSSGLLVTKPLPLRIPLEIPMKSSSPPSPSPVNETCENRCRWSTEKSSRKRRFDALLFGWIQARDPLIGGEAFPSSSPRCPVTIIHFDRSKRADLLLLLWARLSEERSTEINCAIKKWKGRGRRSTRGEGGVRVCAKLGADVIQGGGEKWVARRVEWLFRLVPSRSYSEKSDEDRK